MAHPDKHFRETLINNTDGKDIVKEIENRPDDAQLKGVKKDGTPNISNNVRNVFRKVELHERASREWRARLGWKLFQDLREKCGGDHGTDRQKEILGRSCLGFIVMNVYRD